VSTRYEELLAAHRAKRAAAQWADTELFAEAEPGDWPARPEVDGAEQQGLGLAGSAEALYRAWRATPESDVVLTTLRTIALEWLAQGATQIGPRGLWEAARRRLTRSVDNRLQALACREVESTTPTLQGKFRHRQRSAS
jgi:hypothetical protein